MWEGAIGVVLLEGVWHRVPSFTLWKWARAAMMAELPEMAETVQMAGMAGIAATAEVTGESAADKWRNSEERKVLPRGLVTVEDAEAIRGVDWTDFRPCMFESIFET